MLNAIDAADDFLGHLFLEERAYAAAKPYGAFFGFHEHALLGDIGAGLKGDRNLIQEAGSRSGSGN